MKTVSQILVLSISLLLIGCKSDIRTKHVKNQGLSSANEIKGKALLDAAWKAQGLDKLKQHQVYSFHGHDTWKGILGSIGKVWPEKNMHLDFKYEIGSFDGQVEFTSGKKKGRKSGIQNWKYYEIESDTIFMKPNSKVQFGLSAFQYFVEMADRLRHAPIILYAGEKTFRNKTYDLVFCTWNNIKPQKDVDQYIAWINKETGLVEFTQYTIRENFMKMPGAKIFYGGIEYTNNKSIDGILIPHTQTVYAFNLKTNQRKFIHQLEVSNFEFDAFSPEALKIDKSISEGGDFKP